MLCFLLPPSGSGTLYSSSRGLGRGGARSSGGGACSRLSFGLRDLNGELGRDDCFRGQSWLCLREFLSMTVHTDLEGKRESCKHYPDIFLHAFTLLFVPMAINKVL